MKPLFDKPARRPGTRQAARSGPTTEPASQVDFIVKIKPSSHFILLLLGLHAFSLLALWKTPYLPGLLLTPLVILVFASATLAVYRSVEHTTLAWLCDEQILLSVNRRSAHRLGSQQVCHATVSSRSLHCSLFILLEMRDSSGRCRHCLIPRDAVSVAGFRKLRARLYLRERATD